MTDVGLLTQAEIAAGRVGEAELYPRWFPPVIEDEDPERKAVRKQIALQRFAAEACRTIDELDDEKALKPFPVGDFEYIRIYFGLLCRENRINVAKSRQLMFTWATLIYVLWCVLRQPYQRWAWITKKEEDGHAHIEQRLKDGIWENMPEWLTSRYGIKKAKGHFIIDTFDGKPWRSQIVVFPQGADQLRQYTLSGFVVDEAAFQRLLGEMMRGMMPTTIGRKKKKSGQGIVISSAKRGSHFHQMLGPDIMTAVKYAKGELVA